MDFEGTYGLDYGAIIRRSIPAYEALLEIGAAALAATVPEAATALVVGPGRGEELPGLLEALPRAAFTLVEPSVLHLLPSEEQAGLLQQLADRVAPGGSLLLSGYSEDPDAAGFAVLRSVAQERNGGTGAGQPRHLLAAGMEPPRCLLQALAIRLWLSRRPA
ncbi:MAG: hypothetical protein ACODUE_05340 [Synechococcus sp.]